MYTRALLNLFIPSAYGSIKFFLYQDIWASPTSLFARVGYNKPTKSSADGGIKKLNLPLLEPLVIASTIPYLFLLGIPVFFSNISLKVLSNSLDLLNFKIEGLEIDFTNSWTFDFTLFKSAKSKSVVLLISNIKGVALCILL